MSLSEYGTYLDSVNGKPSRPFARVNARYVMARKFRHAKFRNTALATEDGYSALIKVGLAYSALESAEKLPSFEGKIEVSDLDLAAEFRSMSFEKIERRLMTDLSKRTLKEQIEALTTGDSQNLRPVAEGLRHLAFHGNATVSGMGLKPGVNLVLDDLADAVLDSVNAAFSSHVLHMVGLQDN